MSQQTQKQKDAEISAKNDQAYVTAPKKVDVAGFKTPDAINHDVVENLDRSVVTARPIDAMAEKDDNPSTKAATTATPTNEEAAVDAPAKTNLTGIPQADAKRDATPAQQPTTLNA